MTAYKGLGTYGNAVGVVTPLDHKLSNAAMLVKTTTPLLIRPGVFYAGNASLVAGTAGMAYSVSAYEIATQRSASAGVVFGGNDGTLSVATTAAPGSNSRYDVVYHWHREYSLDGTDSNPVIGVVQGTAAASPTVPSLAAFPGAIELARILVPAGVTATNSGTTITQTAPFTALDGNPVPFRTTTERDAWTTALTLQQALDLSTSIYYQWSGSAWVVAPVPYIEMTNATTVANAAATVLGTIASSNQWTEVADASGWHDPVTNATRITPTRAGRYLVILAVAWASNASGVRYSQIGKNGTFPAYWRNLVTTASDDTGGTTSTAEVTMNGTTDYIEGRAFQNSGGGLATNSLFVMRYLGPS